MGSTRGLTIWDKTNPRPLDPYLILRVTDRWVRGSGTKGLANIANGNRVYEFH